MTPPSFLSWIFGPAEPVEEDPPAKEESKEPAPEAKTAPTVEAIKNVRDDLTKYGTAIGVGSVVLVGGSAVVSYDSMFPLASDWAWYVVALTFGLAIVGSVALTSRFFIAKRRVLIDTMDFMEGRSAPSDASVVSEQMGGMSADEREVVERRLKEFAIEEGVADVTLAEARAERLLRVASVAEARGEADVAKYARAESQRLCVAAGVCFAVDQREFHGLTDDRRHTDAVAGSVRLAESASVGRSRRALAGGAGRLCRPARPVDHRIRPLVVAGSVVEGNAAR